MGSNLAVYEISGPREVDSKVRNDPSSRRKKRRGCRSVRGGRKRRALVSAAPEILVSAPPATLIRVRKHTVRAYARKRAYSQALIDGCVSRLKSISKMYEKYGNNLDLVLMNGDTARTCIKRIQNRYSALRRSWFRLAKCTEDHPDFIQMRFNVLCLGIDEFHARSIRRHKRLPLESPMERDIGELATVPEITPDGCKHCQGGIRGSPACRHCGRNLRTSYRKNRQSDRKTILWNSSSPICKRHNRHLWRCDLEFTSRSPDCRS